MVFGKFTGLAARCFPEGAATGLWHGKGIASGYDATPSSNRKYRRRWRVNSFNFSYHSNLLNKTFRRINVSTAAARMIDRCGGFDSYIYHTPVSKMNSILGATLQDVMRKKVELDPENTPEPEFIVRHYRLSSEEYNAKREKRLSQTRKDTREAARQQFELAMQKEMEKERELLRNLRMKS